jgi:tRNA-2-methylthio-N6-dimethylallyladenosine synthase
LDRGKLGRFEIEREKIESQYEYMAKVRDLNSEKSGKPKFCYVETYGCQQNEADSEIIRGMAQEMGYRICDDAQDADLIVFNTCAIREHAEQRVFGNVGALLKYKRTKPELIIALCGCMAGEEHVAERIKKSFTHVSLVCNTHELWRFPEHLYKVLSSGKRVFAVGSSDGVVAEGMPAHRDNGVRGWLPIMYGCDNFCSYCIVPYVRGRERSRRPEEILSSAKKLLDAGCKDITLLGQNVNSYGKGKLDCVDMDFPGLLRAVNALDGEFLIRFMTSHPKDAGDELFCAMRDCEKCAPHLHLPFQSGSDRILRLMNRGYTAGHYLELIKSAREKIPGLVLTSDVIVGFPGETEQDFEQTLELIEKVRFDALFTFIYSPRKGTKAAGFEDKTPREEKNRRFERLLEIQNKISAEKHAEYVGKTVRVLVDGAAKDKPRGYLSARTPGGRLVVFRGAKKLIGKFVDVKISGSTTWSLSGEAAG